MFKLPVLSVTVFLQHIFRQFVIVLHLKCQPCADKLRVLGLNSFTSVRLELSEVAMKMASSAQEGFVEADWIGPVLQI